MSKTLTVIGDLIYEVVDYLHFKDICKLGFTCKNWKSDILLSNAFWKKMLMRDILPIQFTSQFDRDRRIEERFLCQVSIILNCKSLKNLYLALHGFNKPLLGIYQSIPLTLNGRGQSFMIYLTTLRKIDIDNNSSISNEMEEIEMVICQPMDSLGVLYGDPYVVSFDEILNCLTATPLKKDLTPSDILFEIQRLQSLNDEILFMTRDVYCGDIQRWQVNKRLRYLSNNTSPQIKTCLSNSLKDSSEIVFRSLDLVKLITDVMGLYAAQYGSHGMELLQISLDIVESDSICRLSALKIIGDPNVPSNELSFELDIANPCDIREEAGRDDRPLLLFLGPIANSVILSLNMRLPKIAVWFRGRGQINRVPGQWEPEWVGMSLVIYDSPLPLNGATMTVIWDDDGCSYRHVIDCIPLKHFVATREKNKFELIDTINCDDEECLKYVSLMPISWH